MSAYVIFYVKTLDDPAALDEYKRLAAPTLQKFGAVFRILRGAFEVLEGEPIVSVIMLEFASMADAKSWYHSPEYQAALKYRLGASSSQAVVCEGRP